MMRTLVLGITMTAVAAVPLLGQNPPRRQQLQQQVVQRFMANYRSQAGLTDEQFSRFQEVIQSSFQQRAASLARERQLWFALESQMRPGVAADTDSLEFLMDAIFDVQEARVAQARAEMEEYASFLSPVQLAQLTIAWRRLQMQIEGVRGMGVQRRQGPGVP
jgi:hypothetical protein